MAKAQLQDGRARPGTHQGEALAERLSDPGFREACRLTEDELHALARIASGRYVRNALVILKAIELKASYAYGRPRQAVDVTASVSLESLVLASFAVAAHDEGEALDAAGAGALAAGGTDQGEALPTLPVPALWPARRRGAGGLTQSEEATRTPGLRPATLARGGPLRSSTPHSSEPGPSVSPPDGVTGGVPARRGVSEESADLVSAAEESADEKGEGGDGAPSQRAPPVLPVGDPPSAVCLEEEPTSGRRCWLPDGHEGPHSARGAG